MTQNFEPVKAANVVDQIIESITDLIVKGEYTAGSKLPNEYEMMKELKVSRNSLREAMKILSATGIVEIRRGDGTYVCSQVRPSLFDHVIYSIIYDMSTSSELQELRQVLDQEIVRFAMEKITEQEMEDLRENVREMERAICLGDYGKAEQLDFAFHIKLIEVCKNQFFIRIMSGVYGIFEKSIINTIEYERESSSMVKHHLAILQCIVDRDEDHVGQIVAGTLETWQDKIK